MQVPVTLKKEMYSLNGKTFYKGFYENYFKQNQVEQAINRFSFMKRVTEAFESSDLNPINLWKYIHGYCDEFAMMLSELYGYEIELAFKGNRFNFLVHAWCDKDYCFIDS